MVIIYFIQILFTLIVTLFNFNLQDSADETTTNGSPLHEDNNGENGDSVASASDPSWTPPFQKSSVDGETELPPTTVTTTPISK